MLLRTMKTGCVGISVVLGMLLAAGPVRAGTVFPYYNDPDSGPDGSSVSIGGPNDNDKIFQLNIGSSGSHQVYLIQPLLNLDNNNDGVFEGLAWNQALGGWFGSDVQGTSLLVTLTSPTGLFPWNQVAGPDGLNQEVVTRFGQTIDPAASYPYFNLGILPAGLTPITLDYHYAWGDGRSGVGVSGTIQHNYGETVTANPLFTPVPEPSTLIAAALAGLFGLGAHWQARRRAKTSR